MIELAKERNIAYTPSNESAMALNDYCERKGIPVIISNKYSVRIR